MYICDRCGETTPVLAAGLRVVCMVCRLPMRKLHRAPAFPDFGDGGPW